MKKILTIILIISLIFSLIVVGTGCNANNEPKEKEKEITDSQDKENKEKTNNDKNKAEPEEVTMIIGGLKGPTSMGLIKLIDGVSKYEGNVQAKYIVEGAPDVLVGKVINGEVDIATLPANVAAVIYNKTKGKYKLISVNTLNVLYLLQNNDVNIESFNDLKGEKVYISGKGATPDFATRYIIEQTGMDPEKDIELVYEMEHSTVASAILGGDAEYAILPQPFVTTVMMKNENIKIALDYKKQWEKYSEGESTLTMTCTVVKKDFLEKNKSTVLDFMKKYEESVNWVNNNTEEAGKLIEKHGILPKAIIAQKAIPNCNIVFIDGEEAENMTNGFYNVLYNFEPKSIGGKLPDEEFYFKE